ncbi:MAG: phage tail protein [Aeromonadaceae bacterium]
MDKSSSAALIPVITKAGLAAVFNAEATGVAAEITHIGLGDNGRKPSNSETKLVNERLRVKVAAGERLSDTQIHITAVADSGPAFWVKEIGFYLSDGTLFAVWSDTNPLAYKSEGNKVPLMLAFDLVLDVIPANTITVVGTSGDMSLGSWLPQMAAVSAAAIDNMARHTDLMFRVMDLEKSVA